MNDVSTTATPARTAEAVTREIRDFLTARVKQDVPVDQDLFRTGLVSSMFAMELVVFLEQTYGIAIVGADLKLDNFRTVEGMTALVGRLLDE
ncbi:acyl carrier protein [Amycolatopsis sp. CA-128772]|uniref:acyl carrier protein n=1 Tax=Amycolatopsis sp. CA-128772 TaxID=2073159 RepID=UPI000CD303F9|nr:acyl carrier protein [Amycolatopsis sp. CA-128772]